MFKKIAIASAFALMASTSFAQTTPGVYAGGQISSTDLDGVDDRETGAGLFVGYQFNETFGLEFGYNRLADIDNFGGSRVNVKLNQMALSGIATLPLSNGFNVFGRLGYSRLEAKASAGGFSGAADDTGAVYGVGLGYAFSPSVGARVEYQKPSSDTSAIIGAIVFKF